MTLPFDIEEQIQYILDKFNFERVWLTMQTLDWKWVQHDGTKMKVPNIPRLKARSHSLLESSYKHMVQDQTDLTSFTTGTGGLQATCYKLKSEVTDDYEYSFTLQFVLAEYDSEDYAQTTI